MSRGMDVNGEGMKGGFGAIGNGMKGEFGANGEVRRGGFDANGIGIVFLKAVVCICMINAENFT
jgi:hypothetical protein